MTENEVLGLGWKRFKENLYPFFRDNGGIIFLWCLTAVMDAYSTTLFMQVGGPDLEMHPLTKACAYETDVFIGPYIAGSLKFFFAFPLLVCWKDLSRYILGLGCVLQTYAFQQNVDTFEYLATYISPMFWFAL